MNKFISVVIPTYNRCELLKKCLRAFEAQVYPKDLFEVIVVDDGSTDDTSAFLKDYCSSAPYRIHYFIQKNRGPAVARNKGIRESNGELIAFTDDDCIVDEKWLMEYSTSFNRKAKIGGVGGTLKTNQTDIFSRYLDYMQIPSPLIIGNEAHYLVTANACYRKDLISRIGGFIEEISKPGCEDPILSQKIKRLGYLLEYNPRTTVLHFHKNNMKSFVKTFFNYGRGKKILEREIQSLPPRRRYSLRNGLQDGLQFPQALSFLFLWYLQGVAYRSGCLKGY